MAAAVSPVVPAHGRPARRLGRFELVRLLGRSVRTLAWRAIDPRDRRERILVMPRNQPRGIGSAQASLERIRLAARLSHPSLAQAMNIELQDGWPCIEYDGGAVVTLAERALSAGHAPADTGRWLASLLDGLAFAHDAGVSHHDIQAHTVIVDEQGGVQLIGLEAGAPQAWLEPAARHGLARTLSIDTQQLSRQRDAAERDVLAAGLMLHGLLAGRPALDEPDIAVAVERLPPHGRDLVALPWSLPRPVPEPLRAIANRATDRQQGQRYRAARTLARALQGWLEAEAQQDTGPVARLLDRVRRAGTLPALPDAPARAARLGAMMRERTDEMAELVLGDLALAFEVLRMVNSAQVRGTQIAGNGPVLTVRRAIAMIGVDGVRAAARALRPWPGPLDDRSAQDLGIVMDHVCRCGRVAQALRPAGYDAEAVYLVAVLQNLGRLVVQYHFPEEATQIRKLMQPDGAHAPGAGAGMEEETAACAVLGIGMEHMGIAVARHWGLDDSVLQMIRRLPAATPVRMPERDEDVVRAVASAANEAIDAAVRTPPAAAAAALDRVAHRYARVLGMSPKDLRDAMSGLT